MSVNRYTLQAYQELMRNKNLEDPEKKRQDLLASFYSQINKPSIEETPAGYQQIADLNNTIESSITPTQTFTNKKSLTQLANDPEFALRADRFLDGIGSNENIFEYLRDTDYSLSSSIVRSFQTGKWTEEQKEDYVYLRDAFNNSELRGFKEKFGMIKDLTGDILLDPLNVLTAIFAIPSGGATVSGRAAIGEAARQGVKRLTKAKLQDAITKETAKSYALYGAAEGMAWGGLHNYFMQDMDIDLGLGQDIDYGQVLAMAGLGAGFGAGVGGVVGAASGKYHSKFVDKEFKFVNEDNIDFVGPNSRELELAKYEIDAVINKFDDEQTEDIFFNINEDLVSFDKDGVPLNPETGKPFANVGKRLKKFKDKKVHDLNFYLAKTIGKPTTEFLELVEQSPTLENFLRKLRYDYDVGVFTEGKRNKKNAILTNGTEVESQFTYGEYLGSLFGKFHYGLAKAFNNLYLTGFRSKLLEEQNNSLKFLLRDEQIGARFLRKGDTAIKSLIGKPYKNILIDEDIANAYIGVRQILNDIFDEASDLGLFRPNTINKGSYLPRFFNYSAIEKDFGLGQDSKFKSILIKSGHADPTNEREMFKARDAEGNEILDDAGKPIQVSRNDDLGTDFTTFGRNFATEAAGNRKIRKNNKLVKITEVSDLTAAELAKAKELKADAIIQDMLQYRYTPFDLRQKGVGDSHGYFQARRFRNIKDNDLDEFLEGDVQEILEQYTTDIAQSMARKKYFGNTLREFDEKEVSKIIDELGGGDEANEVGDKIRTIFKQVTGIEQYRDTLIGRSKFARKLSDWGKLSQQMAHLPFATLSSITEPLILLSRVGTYEIPETVSIIGNSLVKEGNNIVDRSIKAINRIGTGNIKTVKDAKAAGLQKGFNDLEDWQWQELYQTGLALEQSVQERIAGLAGEALHGSTFFGVFTVKEAQNAFFKSNLLTQWTKAVQLASFTTGKMMIRNRIRDLYNHSTGQAVIKDKKLLKYYKGQLEELGIDTNIALRWYRNSLNSKGEFNPNASKGLFNPVNNRQRELQKFQQNFYQKNILGGANRFTKEVILNPSAAEANRPLWFSSPAGSLLTQFAGYPTVFNNTILKRFVREFTTYPLHVGMSKVFPTVALMTATAHVGNLIRSQGKSTQDYQTGEDLPAGQIMLDAWRRWGGLGPLDYVNRFAEASDARKSGLITSAGKAFSGPLGQDLIDSIAYRRGLIELFAVNLPYQSFYDIIFGEGTRKNIRTAARKIDQGKSLLVDETPMTNLFGSGPITGRRKKDDFKPLFAKGGIVKNVPNVKDEPDEMQSRVTGRPFNSTAEFVQDEEDRALKGQMEGLGLREPFILGGLVTRFLTRGNRIVNNYKKGKLSLQKANNELDELESLAMEEQQKMFDNFLKTQDEDVVNEFRKFSNKIDEEMPKDEDIDLYLFNRDYVEQQINKHPLIEKFKKENPDAEILKELINQKDDIFADMSLHFLNEKKGFKGLEFLNRGFELDELEKKRIAKLKKENKYLVDDTYNPPFDDIDGTFLQFVTPAELRLVTKKNNINYEPLLKKIKQSETKVNDSANFIDKHVKKLSKEYGIIPLPKFESFPIEDPLDDIGIESVYRNIPKLKALELEKMFKKHYKLETETDKLYEQLYKLQDRD